MILVLADDFTGAAECAAVVRRFGLTAEVQTVPEPDTAAEVVAVDTGTRSLDPDAAAVRMEWVARAMAVARPSLVFKKVDSVLRGRVAVELAALRLVFGRTDAVLVPANPGRGRVVRAGVYLVDGVPLDRTPFAADPEYPARTAEVRALLAARSGTPAVLPIVPDCVSTADLARIAAAVQPSDLPAGGSEFFSALLALRHPARSGFMRDAPLATPGPVLGVRGSAFPAGECPVPVVTTPEAARGTLAAHGVALLTLPADGPPSTPSDRLARLGDAAGSVLSTTQVGRLLLDGGGTAAAVVHRQGWVRFVVGVPCDAATAPLREVHGHSPEIVVKPGSYPWAKGVWITGRG